MPCHSELAGIKVGDGFPVRIVGVINVSPESFYKGSVVTDEGEIAERAAQMLRDGADIIDVGARSTAPYVAGDVSPEEEARRITVAVKRIKGSVKGVISADTTRASVAQAALKAEADVINDITGLKSDERMTKLAKEYGVPLILGAHEREPRPGPPIQRVVGALEESYSTAISGGLEETKIVLDPAIGFFRKTIVPFQVWDCQVIQSLDELRKFGRGIMLGVSRKMFIDRIASTTKPEERLYGSLAATALAVLHGAHLIRTHDVLPTVHAVKVAKAIQEGGKDQLAKSTP